MPFQPGSGNECSAAGNTGHHVKAPPARPAPENYDLLHAALAEMDCVISLSQIPDLLADDDDGALSAGPNLFASPPESGDEAVRVNMLRQTSRSSARQGRVLALRRRTLRARVRYTAAVQQAEYEQRRLRAQILTVPEEELAQLDRPSVPLRLATHAIVLSLMATALPVGAALMTYNLLKGEDIQMTARLTTLTGLALAVLAGHPEWAQLLGA